MSASTPITAPSGTRLARRRVQLPEQAYLVTWMTRQRRPCFEDLDTARRVIRTMRELDESGWTRSMAWVLMPDHLHWLVQPLGRRAVEAALETLRSRTGRADLWEARFSSEPVPPDSDIRALSRQIVANPLRWGLAEHLGEYPHWDAIWL